MLNASGDIAFHGIGFIFEKYLKQSGYKGDERHIQGEDQSWTLRLKKQS
jgi:hypothetical protein